MSHDPTTDETVQRRPFKRYVFMVALLAVVGCFLWLRPDGRFESDRWKATGYFATSKLKLVDDLLAKHQLVGMTRTEIDSLLGVPQQPGHTNNHEYVYWLGPERSFISIDDEWLGVKFADDVVSEARVYPD